MSTATATMKPLQRGILAALFVQLLFLLGSAYYVISWQQQQQPNSYSATIHATSTDVKESYNDNAPQAQDSYQQRTLHHQHHPLFNLIRSYPNSPHHDPTQQRTCFSFTAVPQELDSLTTFVDNLLANPLFSELIMDCIHISIPDRPLRGDRTYPSTAQLQLRFANPRIILHRLPDYGPMTRYLGPLAYEQHAQTKLVLLDVDSSTDKLDQLLYLLVASAHVDAHAVWCLQGENFVVDNQNHVTPKWDTYPAHVDAATHLSWNKCHFCRAVHGLLFVPGMFADFWYNQSDYHESCFWDDDRWVSYQMERQRIPRKVARAADSSSRTSSSYYVALLTRDRQNISSLMTIVDSAHNGTRRGNIEPPLQPAQQQHRRLGSLTQVTNHLKSDQTCPLAWLSHHPDAFPTARATRTIKHITFDAAVYNANANGNEQKDANPLVRVGDTSLRAAAVRLQELKDSGA
jgi:hypothetical protein